MPGSGKTELAKEIGKRFSLPVTDLDRYIELQLKATIEEIWEKQGEAFFRAYECFSLYKILSGTKCLVSLGGGTPCFFNTMHMITSHAFTIYLASELPNPEYEDGYHQRPLFKSGNVEQIWKSLLSVRKKFYERSDYCLSAYHIEPNLPDTVTNLCLREKLIISNPQ